MDAGRDIDIDTGTEMGTDMDMAGDRPRGGSAPGRGRSGHGAPAPPRIAGLPA